MRASISFVRAALASILAESPSCGAGVFMYPPFVDVLALDLTDERSPACGLN